MPLVIGYNKDLDQSVNVNVAANASVQDAADAVRNAGLEPDVIWVVDTAVNPPNANAFRQPDDYQ
jgi:hypothetical protein